MDIKLKLQFLLKPTTAYVNSTKWDGGMIFPKDEGVGDWKSGNKFELGRAPILEKCF